MRTILVLLLGSAAWAQTPSKSGPEYGKYLVMEVAKCGDCHTPMLPGGRPDEKHWLRGATLDFQPLHPVPGWRANAPDLTPAGRLWHNWGEGALLKYLETGLDPAGKPAGPPMPAYRLKRQDAEAVLAYLRTLR